MLRMRLQFTDRLQKLHRRTLAKHSYMKTADNEAAAQELWTARQTQKAKKQKQEPHRMPCPACAAQGW